MKARRQAEILAIIQEYDIETQDQLLEKLRERPETAEATLTGESFDVRFHPEFCKNLLPEQEDMSQEEPVHDDAPTPQSRQEPMLHL